MSRRRLLLIAVAIIAVIALTYLLTQTKFVQETLAPRVYIIYVVISTFLASLPQLIVWAIFVLIAVQILLTGVLQHIVTWLGLRGGGRAIDKVVELGAVEKYTRWIEQESQGAFFRWRLRQRVMELGLRIIGRNEPIPLRTLEQRLNDNNTLDLPDGVLRYLSDTMLAREENRTPQGRPLLPTRQPKPDHTDFKAMLDYMEEALEL